MIFALKRDLSPGREAMRMLRRTADALDLDLFETDRATVSCSLPFARARRPTRRLCFPDPARLQDRALLSRGACARSATDRQVCIRSAIEVGRRDRSMHCHAFKAARRQGAVLLFDRSLARFGF